MLFLTFTILLLTVSLAKCVRIPTIYIAAGDNYQEIEKFLEMGKGETYSQSATWLALNMSEQYSYENTISRMYYEFLDSIQDSTTNYKRNWLCFNSTCSVIPQLQRDIKVLKADIIYENTQNAINTWKDSPWKSSVGFDIFCKYILPYKIENEPVVNWRQFYKEKYSYLIKGTKMLKEAFYKVYAHEMKTFLVRNTYFPYAQDALLLDKLHCGNCKQRAFHMVYVMRALGIPAAVDYTPIWSNYGNRGHYWVVMINADTTVTTHTEDKDEYIDGAYEKTTCNYNQCEFASSVDSLKKIAKIYRLTFWKSQHVNKRDTLIGYKYLTNPYTCEVTNEYKYITNTNIVETQVGFFSKLFVCTYTQGDGWIPVGKAKQVGINRVDIGRFLHDNIVVISEYANGFLTPVSSPYLVRHDKKPFKIEADLNDTEEITLYRKYLLRNIWINRWAEIIGTQIETSNDRNFNTKPVALYQFKILPTCETCNVNLSCQLKDYLRIVPRVGVFPVFAEIKLFDAKHAEIKDDLYNIYAIGNSLTGDTIVTRKLHDNNLKTTFYKRFPYWIGIDIRRIKDKVSYIQLTMWNDENQIIRGHDYELFYYDKNKWNSLGKRRATESRLVYQKVPRKSLLLLRDYSEGQEERIFIYKHNKQIWY